MSNTNRRDKQYELRADGIAYIDGDIPVKCLFVPAPLPRAATEESIEEYFKQFGGIRKVCVINPCYSGRYFAFVWFNQAVDAAKALAVRNHYIHQRKIRVKPAYSEHQESDDDNCYSEDSDDLFYRDYDPDF